MNTQLGDAVHARVLLDMHKQEKHGGHYLIGCPECWRLFSEWRDANVRL